MILSGTIASTVQLQMLNNKWMQKKESGNVLSKQELNERSTWTSEQFIEVDRVKLQKLGELESSLSSVVNDPTIPKSAKLAKAQEILAKTNNIEAAHLEFVKSADYQSMPTDDEKKEQDAADNDISDEITDSEKANNTESTDTTDNTQDKADNVTDDNNNQVSDIENPDTVDTNASEKTSEKDNHKKEYSTEIKKVTRKLKKGFEAADMHVDIII